ncbi:TIGR02452 family protein [Roseiconus lacunae]|uniref:TIGR02452 family protein n=1 Tax=Roseiconus lacunae TaxID=2605694 RepID=UPI001E586130|nr:TIGR02452 family protein [Roseiconus lacunae]MCD0462302.1 TIGR02452 family protein [Roseiconus lacunae]
MTLKQLAQETLDLIEAGEYQADGRTVKFAEQQESAVRGTRLYRPDEIAALSASPTDENQTIRVVDGTTQVVAQTMAAQGDVALLNFASARNPGGGFLNGAKAQEEDLCRCSGLYPCLNQCMDYYETNRGQSSLLYTDHMIFSPLVPFFKTRGTGELLAEPFFASVITAPAPNSGPFLRGNPDATEELEQTFERRWRNVLRISRDQGVKRLLLGAWGCGAFGGDPVMASRTAKSAIEKDGGGIDEIVFAIPGKGRQSKANLDAFRETFGV